MKLICESMVYFHEEEDVLIDCGHRSSKRIKLFLIWNPYTPLFPCRSSFLFLYFMFFLAWSFIYIWVFILYTVWCICSAPLLTNTRFTKEIVAQTIDKWCALRVKLSRKLKFNEFELSLSEKVCIYHYYVPMFLWCKWELKLHPLKYKEGEYVRPLVICGQYWARQWWWSTIYLCFPIEHCISLAIFLCVYHHLFL